VCAQPIGTHVASTDHPSFTMTRKPGPITWLDATRLEMAAGPTTAGSHQSGPLLGDDRQLLAIHRVSL